MKISTPASVKLTDSLHLVSHPVPIKSPTKVVDLPVHHIVVIDCSGSMSGDLPEIRKQLKNKLPMLMKDKDSISLIWFSSRNEFGVIIEGVEVASVTDLSGVNNAIDRFLRPVGLTGFKQPLQEVGAVITRLAKSKNGLYSMFFMTDGCDNQWSENDILKATKELQPLLANATFVEYGWYCNRPLLTKMAESVGGSLVFSENFIRYEPVFEDVMKKRFGGGKKVEIALQATPMHDLVFAIGDNEILAFAPENGKVLVPESIGNLYYLSATRLANSNDETAQQSPVADAVYASIYLLAQRMKSDTVFNVMKWLGDVRLIKEFSTCFGKQKYSDFQDNVAKCVFDSSTRWVEGYDTTLVPADDAYTVLDLLTDLAADDGNLFYPSHPSFSYQRTGRKRIAAEVDFTDEEHEEIRALTESAKTPSDYAALAKRIDEIRATKTGVSFTADDREAGYPVSKLVLNEDRPNVSAMVVIPGTVELPANQFNLPQKFPTKIFRNFTIVRDGILNVGKLPVSLTKDTWRKLRVADVVPPDSIWTNGEIYELDIRKLPIINRKMVKEVSAKVLFEAEYELAQLKGNQKVYKHFTAAQFPEKSRAGLADQYGQDAADWLAGLGITDNGFSPKTKAVESTDFYVAKKLTVDIKGLASLPKVEDVIKKLEDKKTLTDREQLLVPAIKDVGAFLNSPGYLKASDQKDVLKKWLAGKTETAVKDVRAIQRKMAEVKFSVIVGQVWFKEFSSLDENVMDIKLGDKEFKATVTLKEEQVKI